MKTDGSEQLCPPKRLVDSCTRHKMLLVVFFHHRALLLLPQLSHCTNTGLSRASFSCLGQGNMECPAMACINYKRELFPIPVT